MSHGYPADGPPGPNSSSAQPVPRQARAIGAGDAPPSAPPPPQLPSPQVPSPQVPSPVMPVTGPGPTATPEPALALVPTGPGPADLPAGPDPDWLDDTPLPPGAMRLGIWGAAGGGKTTYLAALRVAIARANQRGDRRWQIKGIRDRDSQFLTEKFTELVEEQRFPPATTDMTIYRWQIDERGEKAPGKRWSLFGGPSVPPPSSFVLELQDVPGVDFLLANDRHSAIREQLVNHIAGSHGLVYLFDPIREMVRQERGDGWVNLSYVQKLLAELLHRLPDDGAGDQWLPQHLAVCITKFDDPNVFGLALEHQWINFDDGGMPTVADEHAEAFFEFLGREFPRSGADLLLGLLRGSFARERTKFFVTSSIGFRLPRSGTFDPDDYSNVEELNGKARIRDAIRPINVLEPLLALDRKMRGGSW